MEKLLFSWGLPPAMVKAGPEEVGREWGSRGAEQDPLATPPLWPRPLSFLATPLLSQVLPRPCSLEPPPTGPAQFRLCPGAKRFCSGLRPHSLRTDSDPMSLGEPLLLTMWDPL